MTDTQAAIDAANLAADALDNAREAYYAARDAAPRARDAYYVAMDASTRARDAYDAALDATARVDNARDAYDAALDARARGLAALNAARDVAYSAFYVARDAYGTAEKQDNRKWFSL